MITSLVCLALLVALERVGRLVPVPLPRAPALILPPPKPTSCSKCDGSTIKNMPPGYLCGCETYEERYVVMPRPSDGVGRHG